MTVRDRRSLTLDAPAKINLHLEVLGKRPDGYHELESLLLTISLRDTLVFSERTAGEEIVCDDPLAGPTSDNLVTRAVRLVREESGREDGIKIALTKRIPIGGGLGGGSSDAATTLLGLNQWWNLGWSVERLVELGSRLGSDVPFFFYGPAAIVRGRGEVVETTPIGCPIDLVLISPSERLSTKAVFEHLVPGTERVPVEPIARALAEGNIAEVARHLHNRLIESSRQLSTAVADLERRAVDWPCLGHLMTGSGSTYFAVCEDQVSAKSLGRSIEELQLGTVYIVSAG
ncbi:4-(cytidine 5'-diphospho)-2-C-methyl-D-erythritol kinase [bacterium]|nr:4-(cytidine 5'-diphospho)-2-C-methyl-D-erythritol kinase [bacterium]